MDPLQPKQNQKTPTSVKLEKGSLTHRTTTEVTSRHRTLLGPMLLGRSRGRRLASVGARTGRISYVGVVWGKSGIRLRHWGLSVRRGRRSRSRGDRGDGLMSGERRIISGDRGVEGIRGRLGEGRGRRTSCGRGSEGDAEVERGLSGSRGRGRGRGRGLRVHRICSPFQGRYCSGNHICVVEKEYK